MLGFVERAIDLSNLVGVLCFQLSEQIQTGYAVCTMLGSSTIVSFYLSYYPKPYRMIGNNVPELHFIIVKNTCVSHNNPFAGKRLGRHGYILLL